jgi:enterochelin esterase family protein
VYTPPNYDAKGKAYPVLYLLHGFSDDSYGWSAVGKANFILDALIAQRKAKPMVVVMPLGYGDLSFLRGGFASWGTPQAVTRNTDLYEQALLTEVMPRVEGEYHVSNKRDDRAIVGLSMGGLESLTIGLRHTDKFAYVGGLSSAAANIDRASLANLGPKTADLRMLWIACGTEDRLIAPNREFIAFLKSKQMPVTVIETPGSHNWTVWRDNLIHFAPLLFQSK